LRCSTKRAAAKLAEHLKQVGAHLLEAAPEDLELRGGRLLVRGSPDRGLALADVARVAHLEVRRLPEGVEPGLEAQATYDPPGTFSNATHGAVVEVDPQTGAVRIERYVVVEDCGVMVNPAVVEGQVRGGVAQGVAIALYERLVHAEDGQVQTSNLMDYLVPTAGEIPRVEIDHLVTPSQRSETGAKGMGEGGTMGAPACIATAVNDAVAHLGIELDELPITPDRLSAALEEVPDPEPGPGQVLVRVYAVGVNPVDAQIRAGSIPASRIPYTPGSDAAGIVESTGDDVEDIKVGDRVYVGGTLGGAYAELALCKEGQVHPLPQRISYAQGAGVNIPYATAYRALFQRAEAKPGETVLVHGATGGVGLAAVQLARAAGMIVIGTGGTERGRRLAAEQGAHHTLDHGKSDYLEQAVEFTDGRGVDVVLEMLANVNLGKDLSVLAWGGRVVVIGNQGTVEINPHDAMGRNAAILGMAVSSTPEHELRSIHAALGAGLENGTLDPVVGQEMPLSDAPRAHEALAEAGAYGKIVLLPEAEQPLLETGA
jgi:NADPH2:quinone reductase